MKLSVELVDMCTEVSNIYLSFVPCRLYPTQSQYFYTEGAKECQTILLLCTPIMNCFRTLTALNLLLFSDTRVRMVVEVLKIGKRTAPKHKNDVK